MQNFSGMPQIIKHLAISSNNNGQRNSLHMHDWIKNQHQNNGNQNIQNRPPQDFFPFRKALQDGTVIINANGKNKNTNGKNG